MEEATTNTATKLLLDEVTGEMVSKNELKKRMQKRARKAANETRKQEGVPKETTQANPPTFPAEDDHAPLDPDAMFKQGFLAEVYKERPTKDVLTRFPPEPNGYLHLGHAKAIAVNFGFARFHGGKTILRFDDTNPDKEKEEFFVAIEEAVQWLGFTPHKITYASDNFQKLYDLAERLIQLDRAYVCHCVEADIKLQRGGKDGKEGPRYRCEHANQDIESNLRKFRDMRDGKYEPQTAFLRMKQDIENPNPQMWDLAAYRIPKDQTHHVRTGDKWKIYPVYGFAHCLCDSSEGITHSLCTGEFLTARESYEWLNKSLGVYEPMQREYGRLNISGTVLSKRSLEKLVNLGIVKGWDDPRLFTLSALRRRGVPPSAILSFINELGVTTAVTSIPIARFEQSVRRSLETSVPRLMLVLDPVRVIIEDMGDMHGQEIDFPFSPKDPNLGSHKLKLTQTVFIDRSDFREIDSPDYFRLAPGKIVGLLRFPHPIKATSFSKDTDGKVVEIRAVLDKDSKKPKAFIHWVPEGSQPVEVRVYGSLFKSDDPSSVDGGFLSDINHDSQSIHQNALVDSGFAEVARTAPWPKSNLESSKLLPENVRFQGIRVAYFVVDRDSTDEKIVLNRIVSLKEDARK
ncbi:glutaminyl-tRNA synthetase [Stachybotrys elegans]|uniref:glutamine--tRNA ligase n=1 Tax=Stachybotrys elegans TaxID=80388 RepID=A0A8K0WME0_9HYPO|nr:glutaminyl-tRNA synthetase [Stachybotrys elegans]